MEEVASFAKVSHIAHRFLSLIASKPRTVVVEIKAGTHPQVRNVTNAIAPAL